MATSSGRFQGHCLPIGLVFADCIDVCRFQWCVPTSTFSADSLHLSLNRKDELQGSSPEISLHSMGITSGVSMASKFGLAGGLPER